MVLPEVVDFSSSQLLQLVKHLDKCESETEVLPLVDSSTVELNKFGTTISEKSKLTVSAVASICKFACPGAFKAISSLSGLVQDELRSAYPLAALDFYTKIVRARFDETLSDKSIVKNSVKNQIDGLIGAGYQYLSNRAFFSMIQDVILQTLLPMVFVNARVVGRTLIVRFREEKPLLKKPHTYYRGLYFVNSELGDHAVLAANMLYHPDTGYQATSTFRKGRVVHTGKDFTNRVSQALQSIISEYNNSYGSTNQQMRKSIDLLTRTSLGFKGLSYKDAKNRAEKLITYLCRYRISNNLAERVVYSTLNQNASMSMLLDANDISVWSNRTVYELMLSLMREASRRPYSYRLILEKIAYELAVGKFSLTRK